MKKGLDFSAVKYCGGGDEDVLYLDQPTSNERFDDHDLEMFSPIRANEVFEIELRPGLNPMDVLERINFDSTEAPDLEYAISYEYPVSWLDEYDFTPANGTVSRLAILRQGNLEWQIVGIPKKDGLVLALRSTEESYLPPARYFSERIIGEYIYHVDGPGPVSWDSSGAVLEAGNWWINAYGGDSSRHDVIFERPKDIPAEFVKWLLTTPALSIFVLTKLKCRWSDDQLVERFNQAMSNVGEVDSGVCIFTQLSEDELNQVITIIKQHSGEIASLIDLMESEQHQQSEMLVKLMESTFIDDEISPIVAVEQLMTILRETSTK